MINRRDFAQAIAATAAAPAVGVSHPGTSLRRGIFYKTVGDIRMCCQLVGSGPLLVYQTGLWLNSSITEQAPVIAEFAKKFTVLTFDARGQGRTTYGSGRATYGRLAADTARLLDALEVERAHFFGHSDGGCVSLELLLNFDDRVKTATLSGTSHNHSAYSSALRSAFDKWRAGMSVDSSELLKLDGLPFVDRELSDLRRDYERVSPNPQKFLDVMKDQRRCWSTEPDISLTRLAAIRQPVLVICAGADQFIPEAAMSQMANAIPRAQKATFPSLSHDLRPQLEAVVSAVAKFTDPIEHR